MPRKQDRDDIAPGAYKLDRDVQNPRPDRRCSRDWRKAPVWNKGARFVVREQRRMGDRHLAEVTAGLEPDVIAELRARDRYTVIELAGDHHAILHRVGPGDVEQYAALAAALTPCEESLSQFMTRIDCESGFSEWLVETGRVTRADLEKWWRSYQYGDDESDVEPPAVVTLPVDDEPICAAPHDGPHAPAAWGDGPTVCVVPLRAPATSGNPGDEVMQPSGGEDD